MLLAANRPNGTKVPEGSDAVGTSGDVGLSPSGDSITSGGPGPCSSCLVWGFQGHSDIRRCRCPPWTFCTQPRTWDPWKRRWTPTRPRPWPSRRGGEGSWCGGHCVVAASSARRIQGWWRRAQVRAWVMRTEYKRCQEAARTIQTCWREYVQRRAGNCTKDVDLHIDIVLGIPSDCGAQSE
ncbi:IQ domain-containing protein F6 isoform X2 [Meleagris gallopavo]|uniref:IQ domain-containing protein F6 isoform X2 n=1 Tax=Meleagris gallopavo TaxID=9103 RepID=UPI00093AC16B|nr:IQ domain-containing protein F6 isoform X2 [Meleagris gallopavo]